MSDSTLLANKLSFKKLRILTRKNGRMKVQFNLTKEEGDAFKNFFNAVNVNDNTEEEFVKAAFILGLKSMEDAIIRKMQEEMKKEEEQAEGPEIIEDDAETTETEE